MSLSSVNRVGTYVMVTLVGMVVAVLAAYYVLAQFVFPLKTPDIVPMESFQGITQARGIITSIERDSLSVSTTTVVTLVTNAGEQKRVLVPLYPGAHCSTTNIFDPINLSIGDTIDVKGTTQNNGDIFPCGESEHHVVLVERNIPIVVEEEVVASTTASTTEANIDVEILVSMHDNDRSVGHVENIDISPMVDVLWFGDIDHDNKSDMILQDCPYEVGCRASLFLSSKAHKGELLRKVSEHFWPGD